MANPHADSGDPVHVSHTFYQGYRINIFGVNAAWSFSATPTSFELPILRRSIFFKVAISETGALDFASDTNKVKMAKRSALGQARSYCPGEIAKRFFIMLILRLELVFRE